MIGLSDSDERRLAGLNADVRDAMDLCRKVAAGLASGTGYQPPEEDGGDR